MISHTDLKQYIKYDPITGLFTWIFDVSKNIKAGYIAGCLDKDGYVVIKIIGKRYYAHILAWFYMTGEWPKEEIDHKDQIKNNNIWDNLREATRTNNGQNIFRLSSNTSGYKGVHWHKRKRKWQVNIKINGVKTYLGSYDNLEEAAEIYNKAALNNHREFAKF